MTEGSQPLVSVLVPAYNAQATLAETLQSSLASSYSNLEIILVDDGSTDATAELAASIARRDDRVRIFQQRHGGVSAALNHGLAQARGALVARLDADDLWHPTKLEKQVALLAGDTSIALTYSFVRYIDDTGRILRDAAPQEFERRALCQCLYDGIVGGGSSIVVRRSALAAAGGFDEGLEVWEDLLVHLKIAASGAVAFVPEYLTGYRRRPGSSSTNMDRSLASWRRAERRIAEEFPDVPAFVRRWSSARRLVELAEAFALEQRYALSARLLIESLASDPVRTSTFLAQRLGRKFSGNRQLIHGDGPLFAEASVTSNCCLGEFDLPHRGNRVRALDEARRIVLRSIDRDTRADRRLGAALGPKPLEE